MPNSTRNEWRRCQTTLVSSGEDVRFNVALQRAVPLARSHGVREGQPAVRFVEYLNDEWLIFSTTVEVGIFSTRFECSFSSSPLVSSVVSHPLHQFRVQFFIFFTRFECIFCTGARGSFFLFIEATSFEVECSVVFFKKTIFTFLVSSTPEMVQKIRWF